MYINVNFSAFCDAFRSLDRNEQFSYQAKRVLFDYLEQYEQDTGVSIELDVIALCCEYTESTFGEIVSAYSLDEEMTRDDVLDWLADNTSVCGETDSGTIVFAQF
jgi:hypothetical protein